MSLIKADIETPAKIVPPAIREAAKKTSKASFTWAKLIASIYEVNPLLCLCGKEMKSTKIITHPTEIWRILSKIGWPATTPEFDEHQDLVEWDICQLVLGTVDGLPDEYDQPHTSFN